MKKKKHYDGDVPTVDDFSDAEVVEILETSAKECIDE